MLPNAEASAIRRVMEKRAMRRLAEICITWHNNKAGAVVAAQPPDEGYCDGCAEAR